MLIFEVPPANTTTRAASKATPPTAPSVHLQLQRNAARTAKPASSAAKLDCEKVGTKPNQRIATSPVSRASVRRSLGHSNADTANTITSAKYRPYMFGSQKIELTRKYVWNSFDLITWSFQKRLRLKYS